MTGRQKILGAFSQDGSGDLAARLLQEFGGRWFALSLEESKKGFSIDIDDVAGRARNRFIMSTGSPVTPETSLERLRSYLRMTREAARVQR